MLTQVTRVPATQGVSYDQLVELFLSGRKATTLRAYRNDLLDFAGFLQVQRIEDAAKMFLGRSGGEANALVLEYLNQMQSRQLEPATINRRVSSLRSLVRFASMLGLITWRIEIPGLRNRIYRDTRGPGKEAVAKMLEALEARKAGNEPRAFRDAAIVHLLFDRVLRRGEVVRMDLSDVDIVHGRVRIIGKGYTQGEWLSIPKPTNDAIIDWLVFRGTEPGPLFHNLDGSHEKGRLSDNSIYRMVRAMGRKTLGRHVRPHGLRHSGITHALDKTNGNVRAVAKFARHARVDTTMLYDDNRQDIGGEIAKIVAE